MNGSRLGGEKWLDSVYIHCIYILILKVILTEFANGLDEGYESKTNIKDDRKVFGLINLKNQITT